MRGKGSQFLIIQRTWGANPYQYLCSFINKTINVAASLGSHQSNKNCYKIITALITVKQKSRGHHFKLDTWIYISR